MRIIVDANIILSALLKNGTTRKILLSREINFYTIPFTISEVLKYDNLIKEKSGLTSYEIKIILNTILENIEILPLKKVNSNFARALKIMKNIDPNDAPILAGAFSITNDGLWTNDKHLKLQKHAKVIDTKEMLATHFF